MQTQDQLGDLFAALEMLGRPIVSVNASAVTGPTPGCVINRRAAGRAWACSATARSNSPIDASS